MKKLAIATLTAILSLQAIASDFTCKSIYEKKFKKNNISLVGTGATSGAAGAGVAISLVASSGAYAGLGILTPILYLFPVGLIGGAGLMIGITAHQLITNPNSLIDAYQIQELLDTSYEDLVNSIQSSREEILAQKLKEFDALITHEFYVEKLRQDVNAQRMQNYLPQLNTEEVIELVKEKITTGILDKKIVIKNALTEALNFAKKKGAISQDTTYEEYRTFLQDHQKELFCPKGRAATYRKVVRRIKKLEL